MLKQYEKQLRQKNKYLKQEVIDDKVLMVYNDILLDLGVKLYELRLKALDDISKRLRDTVKQIPAFLDFDISITYLAQRIKNCSEYAKEFANNLRNDKEKERILGYSLTGPHRDDYCLTVNQRSCYDHFSRGINRSMAILFKKTLCDLLSGDSHDIIYLLDDVFAEIDNENSEMLMTILRKNTQVFYATTTKERHILLEDKVMFNINKGQFISESI